MSDTIRTVLLAVTSASLLLIAAAAFLYSSNGRWVAAGGSVLDTRTGRVCAVDEKRVGFCDDYARFEVTR